MNIVIIALYDGDRGGNMDLGKIQTKPDIWKLLQDSPKPHACEFVFSLFPLRPLHFSVHWISLRTEAKDQK